MKLSLIRDFWITGAVVLLASIPVQAQVSRTLLADETSASGSDNSSQFNYVDCVLCYIQYPNNARQQKKTGAVEVVFDVDENTNVTNVRLMRSSGHKELDEATLEQVRSFKLNPEAKGKKNVRLTVNYNLQEAQQGKLVAPQVR